MVEPVERAAGRSKLGAHYTLRVVEMETRAAATKISRADVGAQVELKLKLRPRLKLKLMRPTKP